MLQTGRNLVICCDGTGQTIRAASRGQSGYVAKTNVLRLFQLLENDGTRQIACYDPGIGTIPGLEGELGSIRRLKNVRDEWLGSGLMSKLAVMYAYLMAEYEPGDHVFLFGFSRGAFTIRALAGMLRCVGLLRNRDRNLLTYIRDVYENMEARHRALRRYDEEAEDELAAEFRRFTRPDVVRIAFMGVWDTVKAYGYLTPKAVPFVRNNELVEVVRHAVAIDERRSPFQMTGWSDRVLRQHGANQAEVDRRIKEVWFAGDHSDVGGGHADDSTASLTKASFDWMLGEAVREGLRVKTETYREVTGWSPDPARADRSAPHDLSRSGIGGLMWIPPREELDNSHFPPARSFRCLSRTGERHLLDHMFPDKVWRDARHRDASPVASGGAYLSIHESVLEKQLFGYAPANLGVALDAEHHNEVAIRWVTTEEIGKLASVRNSG